MLMTSHEQTPSPDQAQPATYVSLLGRQPELSLAELEQVFGDVTVHAEIAGIFQHTADPDIQRLGGSTKLGKLVAEFEAQDWARLSKKIVQHYTEQLRTFDGKITIGISVYGKTVAPRDVQRTGLSLKSALKKHNVSVRLIPNDGQELSTATSHHNKLGLAPNKLELLVVYSRRTVLIAESCGTQNITALAARDQGRPKRDAFVGMLPPKLALMMVNLSGIASINDTLAASTKRILDPFCGTGVVLQEAALLGYDVYGTDLAEKMVDYSRANMDWLAQKHSIGSVTIEAGDATEHAWQGPITAVIAESYLGQPFSAPPAPDKLDKVRRIVDHIVSSFLTNLHAQLEPGTHLCIAVPAWRDGAGRFTFLPMVSKLESLGYEWQILATVDTKKLVYFREDQVVARQLLILKKN
jgi:tRNA G10  N-methylase Trm11